MIDLLQNAGIETLAVAIVLLVAMTWPTCEVKASSNSRAASAPLISLAARISRSTYGWQRIAPWPKMISVRVRMFAPSTVMAIGVIW